MAVKRDNLIRKNIYMNKEIGDFYEDYASKMGVTVSAAMVMALKQFMDAQLGMAKIGQLKDIFEMFNKANQKELE